MSESINKTKTITNALLWGLLFIGVFTLLNNLNKNKTVTKNPAVVVQSIDDSFTQGNLAELKIENKLNTDLTINNVCESTSFFRIANDKRIAVAENIVCKNDKNLLVKANKSKKFGISEKNAEAFKETGEYFAVIKDSNGKTYESKKFEIKEPGFFVSAFRTFISKPMFNALVFLTENIPEKSFGLAIILLTIIVRLLLFIPNQKSMKSQRALQKLKPKLDAIKEKHKGNQQMIAMKTMELYKTHKVNPMSSCLPMLIQAPVMLGVYHSVKDGMAPHLSHFLYKFQSEANLADVNTNFLAWDLSNIPWTTFMENISLSTALYLLFPLFVAAAQYVAISLTMSAKKKQPQPKKKKDNKKEEPGMADQMQAMSGIMKYIMPVIIGFFAATLPAALGLYWFTSTIFGIFQQKLVNHQLDAKPEIRKKIA